MRADGPAGLAAAWLAGTAIGLWWWTPDGAPSMSLLAAGVGAAATILAILASGMVVRPPGFVRGGWLLALGLAVLAVACTQARVQARLMDRLDPALEGRDLTLAGTVASLPRHDASGVRFVFEVRSALVRGEPLVVGRDVPRRVSLGWFAGWHEDATAGGPQRSLKAGEHRVFVVRLRRPHGVRNPHGFDLERHLFAQGLRATGAVREPVPQAQAPEAAHPVQRWRQRVRDELLSHVGDTRAGGVLAALVVGDQSAIARDDWDLFRDTGVAHLMAISGLHVTMFAWATGLAVGAAWRIGTRTVLWLPAPSAARVAGLAAALAYAVFSGWGVPAQRTVWMLAVVTALALSGRRWPWPATLLAAAAVVAAADPWALLDIGFWLSFVAVGLLMASSPDGSPPAWLQGTAAAAPLPTSAPVSGLRRWLPGAVRDAVRVQAVATVGLAPLTLVLFQQVSLVGFVANLVAVPWVTLLVTPLAMLGVLLPPAWSVAAAAVDALAAGLALLATLPGGVWTAAAVPWPLQAAGLLGGLWAVLPLPWRWRLAAVPLLLPLLWPVVPRPAEGRFELVAVDVGQGTAAIVRTRHHLLVYDTGPRTGRDSDAGERILLPLLQARGERRIDRLLLSHGDLDHVGGAVSVLDGLPVTEVSTSMPDDHPIVAHARGRGARVSACRAGEAWTWDGVRFEMLHPRAPPVPVDPAAVPAGFGRRPVIRDNDRSCVLRVTAADPGADGPGPRSVLLTGDVEAFGEAVLLAGDPSSLRADIVFAPHHGSRTSSTPPFVTATGARWVVVQAAYRSRFGHPAPDVVARWRDAGATVVQSPACGAWSWPSDAAAPVCERARARRHWQHPGGAP